MCTFENQVTQLSVASRMKSVVARCVIFAGRTTETEEREEGSQRHVQDTRVVQWLHLSSDEGAARRVLSAVH